VKVRLSTSWLVEKRLENCSEAPVDMERAGANTGTLVLLIYGRTFSVSENIETRWEVLGRSSWVLRVVQAPTGSVVGKSARWQIFLC